MPAADPVMPGPCTRSGQGTDYQVGSGAGQLASLDLVPWESLAAGDTVRLFYRAQPYKGKFSITAHGTASAPVRVCGVKGPNGERPIVDGADATTRAGISYGRDSANPVDQARGLVMIIPRGEEMEITQPTYIQIDGLKFQRAHPDYGFTDSFGVHQTYSDFGACIWVERGHHITIADNEITDCTHAILSRSQDGGEASVTEDLRIAGNNMYGNGVAGSFTVHTTYIQSVGVTYEFNRYGPMRAGALGNSIKDRSVGTVVRYNRIEDGAYGFDLVEAEDFPETALANPAYRTTYVYGNQVVMQGPLMLHYGGDKGYEPNYRKGTLYFFNNTVRLLASGDGAAYLFRLSTTDETAQVWNNIFSFDPSYQFPSMRTTQEVNPGYTSGGILNLGVNWINTGWADSDPWHPVGGQLNGSANMVTGTSPPMDLTTLVPLAGGGAIANAQAPLQGAAAYAVDFQLNATTGAASPRVDHADLGAVEP